MYVPQHCWLPGLLGKAWSVLPNVFGLLVAVALYPQGSVHSIGKTLMPCMLAHPATLQERPGPAGALMHVACHFIVYVDFKFLNTFISNPMLACAWCTLQEWPEALLSHELCEEVVVGDVVVFRYASTSRDAPHDARILYSHLCKSPRMQGMA